MGIFQVKDFGRRCDKYAAIVTRYGRRPSQVTGINGACIEDSVVVGGLEKADAAREGLALAPPRPVGSFSHKEAPPLVKGQGDRRGKLEARGNDLDFESTLDLKFGQRVISPVGGR